MATQKNEKLFISPAVPIAFPSLLKPDMLNNKFRVTFVLPGDWATLDVMFAAVERLSALSGKIDPMKLPYKSGEEWCDDKKAKKGVAYDERFEVFRGAYLLSASTLYSSLVTPRLPPGASGSELSYSVSEYGATKRVTAAADLQKYAEWFLPGKYAFGEVDFYLTPKDPQRICCGLRNICATNQGTAISGVDMVHDYGPLDPSIPVAGGPVPGHERVKFPRSKLPTPDNSDVVLNDAIPVL